MTKGRVAMPAIQWFATLGLGLLLFAVNPQAHAQQKMEFKFNLQDLLPTGKQEAAPDQVGQLAENQVVPVEQRMRRATTREAELEARRAQRNEMFKNIDESDKRRLEGNVALSEAFVVGDAPYWMQRAEQCQEIMLKAKGIPEKEKYKNPEMVASMADETMECLWSLESELRSKGELTRLESCFADTFAQLPPRAQAESQHGVLIGEEFIGAGDARTTNKKVKNTFGIQNRPLVYLDIMWRATAEAQSALSYTQIYKMLFFDVGVPKGGLNKAESQEQTRSRMKKFAECTPLGPMLGKPLPLIQKQSTWTFIAANPVFEKRTEKVRSQKLANAKAAFEKRMAEIREARLQEFRRGIGVGTNTSSGTVVEISQDGKKAVVERRRCTRHEEIPEEWACVMAMGISDKSQCAENNGTTFFTGRSDFVCAEYEVTERSWKNINELKP